MTEHSISKQKISIPALCRFPRKPSTTFFRFSLPALLTHTDFSFVQGQPVLTRFALTGRARQQSDASGRDRICCQHDGFL